MMLGPYLEELLGARRQAGIHDCCTLPANWAIACGRPDPMQRWRGTYLTDEEAERMIGDAGDLAMLFDVGMDDAGIREVSDPECGDIGVVELLGHQAGAIFTGRRWAFVPATRGLGFVSLDPGAVLRLWRP